MAKTKVQEPADTQDKSRKLRKKQARQEARIMLKLDQAKKDVNKAQQKVTRLQEELSTGEQVVRELEQKLAQLRQREPGMASADSAQQQEATSAGSNGQVDIPSDQTTGVAPADEERADSTATQHEQGSPITDEQTPLPVDTGSPVGFASNETVAESSLEPEETAKADAASLNGAYAILTEDEEVVTAEVEQEEVVAVLEEEASTSGEIVTAEVEPGEAETVVEVVELVVVEGESVEEGETLVEEGAPVEKEAVFVVTEKAEPVEEETATSEVKQEPAVQKQSRRKQRR